MRVDLAERIIKLVSIETLFLALSGLFGLWILLRVVQRGADPADLIIGNDGKLAWTNVGALVGGTSLTYGFLHMVTQGTLTEWFFNGYGVIMFGTAFAYKVNAIKAGLTGPTDVHVSAPTNSSVSVTTSP